MVTPWGKFISLDDSTSKKSRFDVAQILISTSIMESILVKRWIKVNGVFYNLKFMEEEMANSLFSMKYDFLPNFKTNTEHEESWSEGVDIEEEPEEKGREDNRDPSAGDEDMEGTPSEQNRKDKRVSVLPVPEAHFEFEGDMHDDDC
ncbi:hypothetical protein SLA2020_219750 [Shorea laevis]